MDFLSKFIYPYSVLGLGEKVNELNDEVERNYRTDLLKNVFGLLDLTTLNSTDTKAKVKEMCLKVNGFKDKFPTFPNVAAVCVYPSLVSTVKSELSVKGIEIASVSAGFPSSQTYLEVKKLETKMAIENGASEIDIVISLGEFLAGNMQLVFDEIASIKNVVGNKHLKVILETGALVDPLKIWEASMISMHAGADFIKTSTGKIQPAATAEASVVMVEAIKQFNKMTGKMVGFKPAGGISNGHEALIYYTIVKQFLGEQWLSPTYFRIGASSLANNLLSEVAFLEHGTSNDIVYF